MPRYQPKRNAHREKTDGFYRLENQRHFNPGPPVEPDPRLLATFEDSQAKRVVLRFGGVDQLLEHMRAAGIHRTKESIYHWIREGFVPPNGIRDIFVAEITAGIRLTDADWSPYSRDREKPWQPKKRPETGRLVL